MEVLERLQPLDILFAVLWAAIVGWGLQAGFVRMIGMLVGVYGAALLAGSIYREAGQALALAFGRGLLPLLEFAGYVSLFVVTFGVIGLLIWRAYPSSRIARRFGAESLLGAALGAVWGVLFLIALLTMLRYYAALPWPEQETTQQTVRGQVQLSQVAPVLQVVGAPLWQIMAPWFPAPVARSL
jgi:hypothetical protein